MTTILVTGFGPFPGAPFNPTGPLVERLARLRRPGLADIEIIGHIFPTSYAAVDRDLPKLIARHRPDALLMFGLAPRAEKVRIEMRARNALALLPDADGASIRRTKLAPGGPAAISLPARAIHLFTAARAACVPVMLSRDAGRYLCNYLCWRAAEAARKPGGPRIAAFVHVPKIRKEPRPRRGQSRLGADDLARAGTSLLLTMAAATRR